MGLETPLTPGTFGTTSDADAKTAAIVDHSTTLDHTSSGVIPLSTGSTAVPQQIVIIWSLVSSGTPTFSIWDTDLPFSSLTLDEFNESGRTIDFDVTSVAAGVVNITVNSNTLSAGDVVNLRLQTHG